MTYEIDEQKMNEGLEEYAKSQINQAEMTIDATIDLIQGNFLDKALIKAYDMASGVHIKRITQLPKQIREKYLPEAEGIIVAGRNKLEKLINEDGGDKK